MMEKRSAEHSQEADVNAAIATTAAWTDQITPDEPPSPKLYKADPRTPCIVASDTNLRSVDHLQSLNERADDELDMEPSQLVACTEAHTTKPSYAGCSRAACNPPPPTLTKLAHSRVLIIVVCLTYLVSSFTVFNIGIRALNGYVEPRMQRTSASLEPENTRENEERLLYGQLEQLLAQPLASRFMESHEQCLSRGLKFSNVQFSGVDFTLYPDIRNQTMDWITENCGRLFHVPNAVDASPQQAAVTYWAKASYRARKYATKAYLRVKKRASLIWTRLVGSTKQSHDVVVADVKNDTQAPVPRRLNMPFGFEAYCNTRHPCRLTYQNKHVPPPVVTNVTEVVTDAKRIMPVKSDETFMFFKIINGLNMFTIALYFGLEVIMSVVYLTMSCYIAKQTLSSSAPSGKKPRFKLREDERYACGSLIIQIAVFLARSKLHGFTNSGSWFLFPFGLANMIFAITELLNFFFVDSQVEHVLNFGEAIFDLCLIVSGFGIPCSDDEATSQTDDDPYGDTNTASDKLEAASKIAARLTSPNTTLQEDIQVRRKRKDARLKSKPRFKFTFGPDTDSDTDFNSDETDDEVFVDLAGSNASPAYTRNSGWFIVDDMFE